LRLGIPVISTSKTVHKTESHTKKEEKENVNNIVYIYKQCCQVDFMSNNRKYM
jgi:hypothetical protein